MATEQPNIFDKIQNNVITPAFQVITEIQRLFPDSVMFGSFILYVLTLNKPFGVFSLFLFETTLAHKLLSGIYEKTFGPTPSGSSANLDSCYPGFRAVRKETDRILRPNTYPSLSIFSMFAVASYLLSSMTSFQETLSAMGTDWNSRYIFSTLFVIAIPIFTIIIRYFIGCETFGEISFAAFAGLLIGLVLYIVNLQIFDKEAVNFLGLPYLVDKSKQGSDIYVCTPTSANSQ